MNQRWHFLSNLGRDFGEDGLLSVAEGVSISLEDSHKRISPKV